MKIGLVLAGGGGRGSYEIGVWKALRELGIDKYIQVVSGTSIGALNAVLFMQGDIQRAERAWYSISKETILPTDNFDLIKKGVLLALGSRNINFIKKYMPKRLEQGNISRQGLIDVMDRYIDFYKVINSNISCYVTCSEIPGLKARYFKLNSCDEVQIRCILRATSAIPAIYECEEIENRKYIDGGMADNVPIQPVYGQGCEVIIIVHLEKGASIEKQKFPNTKIVEIIPREMQGGILDFSQEGIRKRIQQGYSDTKDLLEPIFELSRYQFMRLPGETVALMGKNFKDMLYKIYSKPKVEDETINE